MSKNPKILFICSFGEIRSPAAANYFGGEYLVKGISGSSSKLIRRMCEKADKIYVFEAFHIWFLEREYPEFMHKVSSLNVEDIYPNRYDPELRKILHLRWSER